MPVPEPVLARWFPVVADSPERATRHRIADHVRGIAEALVAVDVARADLDDVELAAAALRDRLEALPSLRIAGSLTAVAPPDGALVERSPVSGRSNALAMPLNYRFEGERTFASAVFSGAYEGPPGGVHGGYVAAALDEVLGVAQMASGAAGYTGSLTIRYHRITPLRTTIEYEASPAVREGRKITVTARSTAAGVLLSEAEGVFVTQDFLAPPPG
jgi:hypothetical protein